MTQTTSIQIPGSDVQLIIERDADGHLRSISAAGRQYVRVQDSIRIYDGGFVTMNEVDAPAGMLRHVRVGDESWAEAYLRDSAGLPERIDGVDIVRDEHGRIIACDGPEGAWRYRYEAEHLTEIISPHGSRRITRAADGRPVVVEENGVCRVLEYDGDDCRSDIGAAPNGWNRDDQGRLWTVTAADGGIGAFYLWDGFHCLGRVDGAPGEPLAAVFSLDQTGTPVRIITRSGVTRIARDAFGEGLLAHHNVPGLFGGAHHGEMFHYSARVLDPRLGSYNAPDPWHGREDDPRRADGYTGTLVVENPVAGPYVVCQYDPIGFVDPTGTIAWYYLLSTLTWAFPNNMLTWVGYELTTNFWASLLTGQIDRFFTGEHLYSERFGIGAMQLDGAVASKGEPVEAGPVYTTQHIIWAKKETFAAKAWVSAFVPGGAILPRCYGTILRVAPDAGRALLLRGSMIGTGNDTGYLAWARAGGEAAAVAPGILETQFPSGGFHFSIQQDLYAPLDAAMTELQPAGAIGQGTLDNRLTLTILRTGLGVADGALVLITGTAGTDIVEALSVEEIGGMTIIRLREQTLTAGTTDLHLRGLGARQSSELLARGAQGIHLNVTSASATYAPNDALRLIDGGNPAGAVILTGFEAQIAVDAPLPNTLRRPISVFALAPSGQPRGAELTAQANVLAFPNDPIPNVGDFLTVSNGSITIPVAIVTGGTDRNRQVDRPIDALGAAGTAVSWQELTRGSAHGNMNADPEAAAQITYQPIIRGSAPASGFVGVEDTGGALTARTITGVNYDVLVLGSALPAGPAQFTVERYIPGGADIDGLSAVNQVVLALGTGVALAGEALRLVQLGNTDLTTSITGSAVLEDLELNGDRASLVFQNPGATTLNVADAVALNSNGTNIAVVLQSIEMTMELDRDLVLADEDLSVVQLGTTGPVYDGARIDPLRVVVAPVVGGIASQMPRFFAGEIVLITGTDTQLVFRIANVAGTTLTLEGDAPIPSTAGTLGVQRMTVVNPRTGGGYLGIEGTPVHQAADHSTRYVRARFWTNQSLAGAPVVGIVSGDRTLPARVTSILYGATQSATAAMEFVVNLNVGGNTSPNLVILVGDILFIEWTRPSGRRQGEFVVTSVSGATIEVAARSGGSSIPLNSTDVTVRPRISSYNAVQPDPANLQHLTVQPTIRGVAVAEPQFQVGDAVFIEWLDGSTTRNGEFDVTAVTGTNTIDVAPRGSGTAITVATPNIFVRRLPVLDLTFSAPPAGAGATGDLFALTVMARHFTPGFRQESDSVVIISSDGAGLTSPSPNIVLVIPFAATAVTTGGHLSSGTVKAPDDPEHWEYDRRKAVAEHELRHTQQYNWFGPLWFCMFPMWAMDTITAATTDMEQPAYSAFVRGRLRHDEFDERRELEIPDMQSIPFATGDEVQVYSGNDHGNVQLGPKEGNVFLLIGTVPVANGDVFVRRHAGGWGTGFNVFMNIMRGLTPGSVMNLLMTVTYGSLYQGIGRGIYQIMRWVDNGTLLPATVEQDGLVALLSDPSKLHLLRNEARVIVRVEDGKVIRSILDISDDGALRLDVPLGVATSRSVKVSQQGGNQQYDGAPQSSGGAVKLNNAADRSNFAPGDRIEILITSDTTVVKSVDSLADDGRITFRGALPVSTGQVKVAPYETHTPGTHQHWNSYYPATVDPQVRATVTLHAVGNDSLTLRPRDRVRVLFDENQSFGHTTTVTAVNGDRVDLAEMIPTLPEIEGQELIVRLAKIGRDDPTGVLDQRLVDDLYDAGWVRWITDPFSQTFHTVQQRARGSFWDHFTRVASYLLGTHAWSLLPFGFYWWDALFLARARGKGYLAFIEQDASVHSGDLYTSIGRLRNDDGEMSDDKPEATMTVGDIALYWFWPGSRWVVLPTGDNQGSPGVHLTRRLCAMPLVTDETGGAAPNNGAEAAPVADEPGHAVPDVFFRKSPTDPRDTVDIDPRRFTVNTRGWVPMEPGIQRTLASYIAFTRPTTGDERHRVTINSTGATDSSDRDAQDEKVQVIFYNVRVNDVTVTISGVNVANGDTVTLLQTQRSPVTAVPNGQRRYRATVPRPGDGPALRTSEEMVLQAGTSNTTNPEPVEISRFYHYDTAARQFDTGAIRGRGMHLPTDVDIPVRMFNVVVVNTPPVVASLPATADFGIYNGGAVPPLRPGGEVFVLVAASVMTFNDTIQYNNGAPPAGTIDPVIPLTDATANASEALRTFLANGLGRPFRLGLEDDDPPEEVAFVNFEITVGEPGNQANLSVAIPINGHFLASNPGGYQIPRGGTLVLNCAAIGGGAITPLDTVQVTMTNGTPPPPAGGNPELSFSVAGSQLTITARADASTGVRRLLITDSASATNRARRTVEIV